MKKIFMFMFVILLFVSGCVKEVQVDKILGSYDKTTYKNEFANLCFTLPVGWEFTSSEDLFHAMKIDEKLFKNKKELINALINVNTIYDMRASNEDNTCVVTVFFQNTEKNGISNVVDYAEMAVNNLKNYNDYESEDYEFVELAGEKYLKIPSQLKNKFNDKSALNIYMREKEGYIICIAVKSSVNGEFSDWQIENMIEKYE